VFRLAWRAERASPFPPLADELAIFGDQQEPQHRWTATVAFGLVGTITQSFGTTLTRWNVLPGFGAPSYVAAVFYLAEIPSLHSRLSVSFDTRVARFSLRFRSLES
jgi:hypothetical protein